MDYLAEGRKAIEAIAPDFVRLVRASTDVGNAIGHWGTAEVACHVSHVIRYDGDSLAGRALPESELRPSAVAVLTDAELEADPERDLSVLADRIEGQLAEFLALSAAPPADEATWLGGIKLPASAVVCHLLEELLVHGFDLAHATKQEWPIAPRHASLAVAGAALEIVNAGGRRRSSIRRTLVASALASPAGCAATTASRWCSTTACASSPASPRRSTSTSPPTRPPCC